MSDAKDLNKYPYPSKDYVPFAFNVKKIDEFVNSTDEHTDNRKDRNALTWFGIEEANRRAREALNYKEVEYVAGNKIDGLLQYVIAPDGNAYQVLPTTALPYELTGDWATDSPNFMLMGDLPLRNELAGTGGAGMIGYGDFSLPSFLHVINFMAFSPAADGTTDDSGKALLADASGFPVFVPKGEYFVKNITLSGTWIFEEGAYFVSKLGARDNAVLAGNGLRMYQPNFKKSNTAWPDDGDFGNALRIGTYRQAVGGSNTHDIEIYDIHVENIGTQYTGQAIEVLGDVRDVKIHGLSVVGSGAGIICHWGGDIGDSGAHVTEVTYSYHPHSLDFKNFYFGPDASGRAPSNTLILSACYDVKVDGVRSRGVRRTAWVFPGDVYDEVSVPRDKGKIMTGIRVMNVTCDEPVNGEPAIDIGGMPATKRTSQPTVYARDDAGTMDIVVDNVSIMCKDIQYSSPLVRVRACKNIRFHATKTGGDRSPDFWANIDYNENCDISLSGVSVRGERLRANTNCRITVSGKRRSSLPFSGDDAGCTIVSHDIGNLTFSSAPSGAEVINVLNAGASGSIFNGSFVMISGEPVAAVKESVVVPTGIVTEVKVTPLSSAVASGTIGKCILNSNGTTISGFKSGFLKNFDAWDAWGMHFNATSENAGRHGMVFSGPIRDISVSSEFSGTGSIGGDTLTKSDINVASPDIQGFSLVGCSFDASMENKNVQNRLIMNSTNHSGVLITQNKGTKTLTGVPFALQNSARNSYKNMQQIYGNDMGENDTGSATITGMYVGSGYRGIARNNAIPTSGRFNTGDYIDRATPIRGGDQGWVCVESGSPGVWVGYGRVGS